MNRADEMRAVFERHESSGLSLRAYGEREGIAYTTLQYWRRRLRGATGDERSALAPVHVTPDTPEPQPPAEHVGVWLANGVALEVPRGFDEGELRRLVDVLSAC